jgi:hypothetical protein
MNLEKIKKELERMEDAEAKILDILLYGHAGGATDSETKLATSTLFDVTKYIMELKYYIEQLEGDQDE